MSFFTELRRRNVIRVAIFYVVSAWLMVQVADVILPAFAAPDWVMRVLLIVLAVGLAPTLGFAWVFELTPDGLKRESEISPEQSVTQHTARKLDIAVIVLLLVIGGLTLWKGSDEQPSGRENASGDSLAADVAGGRSIAVLPFADMSAAGDQAYFGDGIAEELLNLLARSDGLRVAARTSSFQFREAGADIPAIGRALGVETVLEGSVRKAGDQVRITAQLIDVEGGFHLWSQSYDRELTNIFSVQDDIAKAIVEALKLQLDLAEETVARTDNVQAYDLYLRGRKLAQHPTREGLLEAVGL